MFKRFKKKKNLYRFKQDIQIINLEELFRTNKDKLEELLHTNKNRIECYQNINTDQLDNTKACISISARCPQRSYPPIEIKSELYAVGFCKILPDEYSLKPKTCIYKLDVRRGTHRLILEYNTLLAMQIYNKMYKLYNNRQQ